jgi:Na+-translocating ferredoxin:NAD+ oxidoreductase subunit B
MGNIIIISISVLGTMGVLFGLGLAYASKKFHVKVDKKISEISKILPGLNCGGCGYPNCDSYAESVVKGEKNNLCKPGGEKVECEISKIMGNEFDEFQKKEKMVAQRYCNGGKKESKIKFEYKSIKTCKAAILVNNGNKQCVYSCLGFGDCSLVCPVNAIIMDKNDLPNIDKDKCIGCEKCVLECPRSVLHMAPKKSRVHVRCMNKEPAKNMLKKCVVGCISCGLCVKECPVDAIHIINNLAQIDYSKCISCGKCAKVCPRKIIIIEEFKRN